MSLLIKKPSKYTGEGTKKKRKEIGRQTKEGTFSKSYLTPLDK